MKKRGRPPKKQGIEISPDTILNEEIDDVDDDVVVDDDEIPVDINLPITTGGINKASIDAGLPSPDVEVEPQSQNFQRLEQEIENSPFARKTQKQIGDMAKVIEALYQQHQNTMKAIQQLLVKEISPSQGTEIQKVEQQTQQSSGTPYWLEALKNLKDITTNWAFITQQAMQGQPQQGGEGGDSVQNLLKPVKMAMDIVKEFLTMHNSLVNQMYEFNSQKEER